MNRKRRPLIAGNWKLNHGGSSACALAADVARRTAGFTAVDVVVAPPFTAIAAVAHELDGKPVGVAAQNFYPKDSGALTGEVSAPMLLESGAKWVIIGHSERRQFFGETDASVAEKVAAALAKGLRPIACVGETLEQRERGETLAVVGRQIDAFAKSLAAAGAGVIAYEPVWAIGSGRPATATQVAEMHDLIRSVSRGLFGEASPAVRVLYGGSVTPDNVDDLMRTPGVDGLLVGGASLDAAQFARIVSYRS